MPKSEISKSILIVPITIRWHWYEVKAINNKLPNTKINKNDN